MKKFFDVLFIVLFPLMIFHHCKGKVAIVIPISPDANTVTTEYIQQAIDSVSHAGGGTVLFPQGNYITGGLHLRDNVTLQFDKGAIVQSSSDLADFGEWKWTNGLIMGDSLKNISIIGEGLIDGINLPNPEGEEGFRGPHAVRLTNCNGIIIRDITITRSANWAINCRKCSDGIVDNVTIRGGHDGVHTRFCKDFHIRNCDIRTGDDAFAGNDNQDFLFENCKANTSCNAFRFGCFNLVVKNCHIWGPGEYEHLSQHRNNTLSAFTHFSPPDEDPQLKNGNWLIREVTIDHVDQIFNYNFRNGLWQTGQPAAEIIFENLTATDVKKTFNMIGDSTKSLQLIVRNSSMSERKGSEFTEFTFEGVKQEVPALLNVNLFDILELHHVIFETNSGNPAIMAKNGNKLVLDNVKLIPSDNQKPFIFENIDEIKNP
ncbi:right-handed parallel beta-helix repeat-containing protein [candidate division KSB1 bacterium]|nr:right-handed parallel beta-helix repeat-containing protein [candidate division KSB1 bacterium]